MAIGAAPVARRRRQPACVDVGPALRLPEAEREPRVVAHLAKDALDRLGRRANAAQLLQEVGHPPQRGVVGAVDAPVEPVLHPRTQRPERHGDQQSGRRGRPRRPATERGPAQQVGGRERRGEDDRHRRVDDRPIDRQVDVKEVVAQDRHARRKRHEREAPADKGSTV
jgi:hypothetical protein